MIIHFALPTLLHNGVQLAVRTVSSWCRILPDKKIVVSPGEIRCALSLMLTCKSFRDTVYKIVYPRARIYWAGIDGPHLPLPVQAFSLIQEFRICVMWLYDEERFSRFLGILRNSKALNCLTLDHVETPERDAAYWQLLTTQRARTKVYSPMVLWTLQTIMEQSPQLCEIVEDHEGEAFEIPRPSGYEQIEHIIRGRMLYGTHWVGQVSICVPGYPIRKVAHLDLQYELELWHQHNEIRRYSMPYPATRKAHLDWYFHQCSVCLLDGNPKLTAKEREKSGSAGSIAYHFPWAYGHCNVATREEALYDGSYSGPECGASRPELLLLDRHAINHAIRRIISTSPLRPWLSTHQLYSLSTFESNKAPVLPSKNRAGIVHFLC
jgi:hypothetical protein